MIVADIIITQASFGATAVLHKVPFDTLDGAMTEFLRIAELIKSNKDNGAPGLVDITGCESKLSIRSREITAIGLTDYVQANAQRSGLAERFPNLFRA